MSGRYSGRPVLAGDRGVKGESVAMLCGGGEDDLPHGRYDIVVRVEEPELCEFPLAADEELVILVPTPHNEVVQENRSVLHVFLHFLDLGHDLLHEEARDLAPVLQRDNRTLRHSSNLLHTTPEERTWVPINAMRIRFRQYTIQL